MYNLEEVKNEIKIPDKIDLAVKKGIERGRKNKKVKKFHKAYKRIAAVASIIIIIASIGILNPSIAKAIPGMQSVFRFVSHGTYGENFESFEKLSTSVNKTVEKNGIKVTINEIIIDDNTLAITSTEEEKNLKEDRSHTVDISLNGKRLSNNYNIKDEKIDSKTLKTVLYADISNLKLANSIDVEINLVSIDDIRGPWNFKFKVSKTSKPVSSRVVNIDRSLKTPKGTLKFEKIVVSPMGSTLNWSFTPDSESKDLKDKNGYVINTDMKSIVVMDENGRCLQVDSIGYECGKNECSGKEKILDDLTNVKSITIVPVFNEWKYKSMKVGKLTISILKTTINGTNFDVPSETIINTRIATAREKKAGYIDDKFSTVYNIDKARKFSSIDELINQGIKVGNNNTVRILKIEPLKDYTKVTFKIEGSGAYYYSNIREASILDENYNDYNGEDGTTAVFENVNDRIVSVKLPCNIDKSKKYKIALPIIDDPQIEEKYKVNIDLAKK